MQSWRPWQGDGAATQALAALDGVTKPHMDNETIQQIAAEVVHRLPYGDRPWLFLLVTTVVMALAAGLAAWGGAFLKTKGEHFATKQDFDELQKQLSATTKLVETIKSEVSQRDWAKREWTTLRRIKLEALLEKMHECGTYLDRLRSAAYEGSAGERERAVIDEFRTIADMYFPELWKETSEFAIECRREAIALLDLGPALLRAGDDSAARQRAYDDFSTANWPPKKRVKAHHALRDAARSLLERIMNVDERPRDEQ
jgi:hypothetical protein